MQFPKIKIYIDLLNIETELKNYQLYSTSPLEESMPKRLPGLNNNTIKYFLLKHEYFLRCTHPTKHLV